MKYLSTALLSLFLITSCSKTEKDETIESSVMLPEPEQKVIDTSAVATVGDNGLALIEGSDCLTCHKMDDALIGPSYKSVAAKYENTPENMELLAIKIMEGGKGNWGEISMAAHPDIDKATAKEMVKYILSQR